jgi:hypothetical protein
MKNKIKMGIVEIDGVCIGDVIEGDVIDNEGDDVVVVGFGKKEGEWVVFLNGKIDGEWFEYFRGSEDEGWCWYESLKELKDKLEKK